ncbi:MAG: winged helix-turn-helix transcriptional regulator [Nitrososphaerota archaeon]|nr:winged helix-turn-helix transcriptional regulator [Nitrososphaerota archaeon]
MDPDLLDEVLSSTVRLRIEDALSVRPRTLGELASITGITVQGVLRHLKRLEGLGLVEERRLSTRTKARALYSARGELVGDYSSADLIVVKPTERLPQRASREKNQDIEKTAAEVIVLRRRVREQARRLGRMIEGLVDEQEALRGALDGLPLSAEERLILEVVLTEETLEDGARVLSRFYGIEDRRSIDKALAKVKR